MTLSTIKDVADIVQAFITALALIVGGAWTYLLFVSKRQRFPRAKIEHQVAQRAVSAGAIFLIIEIIISNTGDVLLSLVSGEIEVRQVCPPGGNFLQLLTAGPQTTGRRVELVDWPALFTYSEDWPGKRIIEIEPGESEQLLYTLLVQAEVKSIYLYSYFRNITKRRKELGWETKTFHDVSPDGKTITVPAQT